MHLSMLLDMAAEGFAERTIVGTGTTSAPRACCCATGTW